MSTATGTEQKIPPPPPKLEEKKSTGNPPPKRDYSKLRKAAASQSLSQLREVVETGNWTAKDIDDNDAYNDSKGQQRQRQHASKSALHMAAWKGCLDNVQYLVETLGCDINAYSKQEFSYGKTAIFFALTQSRIDVTQYLLRMGAKVTIVNNKGQSVLSMAATHFPIESTACGAAAAIVQEIQRLEEEQGDWWNFRASHSDGFEYGDLDPRFFLDRPLRPTDVVTPLAVNPTTKATRKGGFLRRNPGAAPRPFNDNCEKKPRQRKPKTRKHSATALSSQEKDDLNRAWESLSQLAAAATTKESPISTPSIITESLLRIVELNDKQRLPWIPETASKLERLFGNEEDEPVQLVETLLKPSCFAVSHRQKKLVNKLLSKLRRNDPGEGVQSTNNDSHPERTRVSSLHEEFDDPLDAFSSHPSWKTARNAVQTLRISCLETSVESSILVLPDRPVFVDTREMLRFLLDRLQDTSLVAIDTEWYDANASSNYIERNNHRPARTSKPVTALSTLQVSFLHNDSGIESYVVDLKKAAEVSPTDYNPIAQELVKRLLMPNNDKDTSKPMLVLGFAIRNDIHHLEAFLDANDDTSRSNNERPKPKYYRHILDLQSVFAVCRGANNNRNHNNLPGLKTCASRYSSLELSKECQCSEWGRRPLSQEQLEYAGLDAAVLLVLLAERSHEEEDRRLDHGE